MSKPDILYIGISVLLIGLSGIMITNYMTSVIVSSDINKQSTNWIDYVISIVPEHVRYDIKNIIFTSIEDIKALAELPKQEKIGVAIMCTFIFVIGIVFQKLTDEIINGLIM